MPRGENEGQEIQSCSQNSQVLQEQLRIQGAVSSSLFVKILLLWWISMKVHWFVRGPRSGRHFLPSIIEDEAVCQGAAAQVSWRKRSAG